MCTTMGQSGNGYCFTLRFSSQSLCCVFVHTHHTHCHGLKLHPEYNLYVEITISNMVVFEYGFFGKQLVLGEVMRVGPHVEISAL